MTKKTQKQILNIEQIASGETLICGAGCMFLEIIALRQYTGLKDKNGVEIYEGDIVDFGVTTNIKEVVFDGESASFRVYEYLYEQGSSLAEKWFLDDCGNIEVIGNIYENPELLETSEDKNEL